MRTTNGPQCVLCVFALLILIKCCFFI